MEQNQELLRQAKDRMQHERKWLSLRLREVYTEEEREQLFRRWGIHQMKERKKALCLRMWDPAVCLPRSTNVPLKRASCTFMHFSHALVAGTRGPQRPRAPLAQPSCVCLRYEWCKYRR
jgi:Domain of unknown function (DUF3490)